MAGTEFGPEQGKFMRVVRELYVLKSSGSAFRYSFAETLHGLGFRPSIAEPDVWMRPEVKPGGLVYCEYVL